MPKGLYTLSDADRFPKGIHELRAQYSAIDCRAFGGGSSFITPLNNNY
jgi:hypothetical protein